MKLKIHPLILSFLFSVSVMSVNAVAEGKSEVFLQGLGLGLLGGESELNVSGGYNYPFFDFMQAGAGVSWHSFGHADTSVRILKIQLGPTFNFTGPYENTYYASIGLGFRSGTGVTNNTTPAAAGEEVSDSNGSGIYLHAGQRIPLTSNISWRPSVGIETGGGFHFVVHVLAISYFF